MKQGTPTIFIMWLSVVFLITSPLLGSFQYRGEIQGPCFNPNFIDGYGGCHDRIMQEIVSGDNVAIVMFMNLFTDYENNYSILDALQERNIPTLIVVDEDNEARKNDAMFNLSQDPLYSQITIVKAPVRSKRIGSKNLPAKLHNKSIIFIKRDGKHVVATGSYHLSANAEENNAENLTFIKGNELAKKYLNGITEKLGRYLVNGRNSQTYTDILQFLVQHVDQNLDGVQITNLPQDRPNIEPGRQERFTIENPIKRKATVPIIDLTGDNSIKKKRRNINPNAPKTSTEIIDLTNDDT